LPFPSLLLNFSFPGKGGMDIGMLPVFRALFRCFKTFRVKNINSVSLKWLWHSQMYPR